MTVNSDPVIISLEEVMTDYKGKLSALLHRQKQKPNILVTWQVEIEVKKAGKQRFFVSVAVCFTPDQDEEIRDIASQLCPKGTTPIFVFIPAYSFGSRDFGIYIAENNLGEILVNGLVNEVIEQAGIEEAVTQTGQ
ncbi:MAG: hypothetical protein ACPIDY_04010 [Candidatus Puniceispirillaceae bacterium]|jgi:hypothetical protein|nr:hypothetical protein [Alphaproteobacteria bacterium]NBX06767.1 hypothetical protein [Pseudomonadota bacterium]